jgi:hypothetical protein
MKQSDGSEIAPKRLIRRCGKALDTDPDVLTGQAPLPDATDDDIPGDQSKLKFTTSYFAQNALHLVSQRYDVSQREIVELAPFLFCCAAEASLRRRREHVGALERACQAADSLAAQIKHLPGLDLDWFEKMIATEKMSINQQDIFGLMLDEDFGGADSWNENPFALFLDALANDTDGVAEFEGYAHRDWPEYRVCSKEACQMVGGDSEIAEDILEGRIALSDMPRDLARKREERAAWIREKVEAFRASFGRAIRETDDGGTP